MPKFMLLLNSPPGYFERLSPEELQKTLEKYTKWTDGLRSTGRFVVADKLMFEGGKTASLQSGRMCVVDGPYSEAKEVVGGYITIRAADYDEALAIVRDCPFLQAGSIGVRQVDPMGCGEE